MSGWLESLPHQIPFRAASAVTVVDGNTAEGLFLVTANDALAEGGSVPAALIVEAMAQIGGPLAFSGTQTHGYLSAIDETSIVAPVAIGDRIRIRVEMQATFGRIFRFAGTAEREGLEVARARFYLAAPDEPTIEG